MRTKRPASCIAIAALVYGDSVDPAPALEEIVTRLRQRGVALAGAIQGSGSACSVTLELLPSGLRIPILQNLGHGALGCRLDSSALAEAASAVRQAIDASPALAIFNKFGAQEAAGHGLRDEMAAAVAAGVPVLTAVRDNLLAPWAEFTGGEFVPLACSADAALAWWDALAPN